MKFFMSIILLCWGINAYCGSDIKEMNWDDVEVTWVNNNDRLPIYTMTIYFGDGALGDGKVYGLTKTALTLLRSGTNRYNQEEVTDALEFYGTKFSESVTHEYSTLSVSGLVKDIVPTVKMVCHLLNDTIYPKNEVIKYKRRFKNEIRNLVADPRKLASRIFRQVTLKDTPWMYPADGNLKGIGSITKEKLKNRLTFLNTNVKKRIYISGPSEVLKIKNLLKKDCHWSNESKEFVRKVARIPRKEVPGGIIFVPVKMANQAQIRVGGSLLGGDLSYPDKNEVVASFLGGGFTSILMEYLRKKNPYTYGAYAFAASQRDYGRRGIITSTRNETVINVLSTIKSVIGEATAGKFGVQRMQQNIMYLAGSSLFQFEQDENFLNRLLHYDHVGRNYDEIYSYPERIQKFNHSELLETLGNIFDWDRQTIVVLGHKSLFKKLKKWGPTRLLKHKLFL
ncbi:insulinase family protein [Bacteriovoracaceae bacterium]|nr:insulinase family protein [Bacteriovoracaceae bacterium]